MPLVKLYDYVKKKSGGNSFAHMSEVNKITYLTSYVEDIIEYFNLKIEKLEEKLLAKDTVILKKKNVKKK